MTRRKLTFLASTVALSGMLHLSSPPGAAARTTASDCIVCGMWFECPDVAEQTYVCQEYCDSYPAGYCEWDPRCGTGIAVVCA